MFSVVSISQSFCPQEGAGGPCTRPQPHSHLYKAHPPSVQPLHPPTRTCSTWTSLYRALPPPKKNMFNLVHYEALTVRKRAVGIRLKSLLVVMTYLLPDGMSVTQCKPVVSTETQTDPGISHSLSNPAMVILVQTYKY